MSPLPQTKGQAGGLIANFRKLFAKLPKQSELMLTEEEWIDESASFSPSMLLKL